MSRELFDDCKRLPGGPPKRPSKLYGVCIISCIFAFLFRYGLMDVGVSKRSSFKLSSASKKVHLLLF